MGKKSLSQSQQVPQNVTLMPNTNPSSPANSKILRFDSILKKGEVEIPSDLAGTAYTEGDDWKISIIKDLKAAGIDIDLDKFMR